MGEEGADAAFGMFTPHAGQFGFNEDQALAVEIDLHLKRPHGRLTVVHHRRDHGIIETPDQVGGQNYEIRRVSPCRRRWILENIELLHSHQGRM